MKNQQPPKCTPVPPQSAFHKDMQYITDTLCVVRTYLAKTDSVMGMVASAIEKSRSLAYSSKAPRADGSPVEYEYRARPHWDDTWTEWRNCPKEIAEEYRQCPDVHGWHYEIREVPQIPHRNELLDQIAAHIRDQGKTWPLAAYEESALIVEGYKEAAPAEQPRASKPDADLLATLREAAKTKAEGAVTKDGRFLFINYGEAEQQMLDHVAQACPHCGGSGHKGDAQQATEGDQA